MHFEFGVKRRRGRSFGRVIPRRFAVNYIDDRQVSAASVSRVKHWVGPTVSFVSRCGLMVLCLVKGICYYAPTA